MAMFRFSLYSYDHGLKDDSIAAMSIYKEGKSSQEYIQW